MHGLSAVKVCSYSQANGTLNHVMQNRKAIDFNQVNHPNVLHHSDP